MSNDFAEQRRKEFIRELEAKHPVPGSTGFQRLEALTGYDGDYTPADVGQPIEEKE